MLVSLSCMPHRTIVSLCLFQIFQKHKDLILYWSTTRQLLYLTYQRPTMSRQFSETLRTKSRGLYQLLSMPLLLDTTLPPRNTTTMTHLGDNSLKRRKSYRRINCLSAEKWTLGWSSIRNPLALAPMALSVFLATTPQTKGKVLKPLRSKILTPKHSAIPLQWSSTSNKKPVQGPGKLQRPISSWSRVLVRSTYRPLTVR